MPTYGKIAKTLFKAIGTTAVTAAGVHTSSAAYSGARNAGMVEGEWDDELSGRYGKLPEKLSPRKEVIKKVALHTAADALLYPFKFYSGQSNWQQKYPIFRVAQEAHAAVLSNRVSFLSGLKRMEAEAAFRREQEKHASDAKPDHRPCNFSD